MNDTDDVVVGATKEDDSRYDRNDDGLRVLLQVRDRVAPDLSRGLLEHCYMIQKKHQFDQEPERPLNLTREVVEAFIWDESSSIGGPANEDH